MAARWREGYDVVYAVREERHGETRVQASDRGGVLPRLQPDHRGRRAAGRRRLPARRPPGARRVQVDARDATASCAACSAGSGSARSACRTSGTSGSPARRSTRFSKMLKFATDGIVSFSAAPLRLALKVGFLVSGLSFLLGVVFLFSKVLGFYSVPGLAVDRRLRRLPGRDPAPAPRRHRRVHRRHPRRGERPAPLRRQRGAWIAGPEDGEGDRGSRLDPGSTIGTWPFKLRRSSMPASCAATSRFSSRRSTASRSPTSTPRSAPQKPRQVLDALRTFYETSYGNVHRGVYTLSERATEGYEGARQKVATFVNAPQSREIVFTRNATESINLVAYAWGLQRWAGRPGRRHRARAPLELRSLAVRRQAHRRRVPGDQADGRRGARPRLSRRDRGRRRREGRGCELRLECARHGEPGRASGGVGARARGRDGGRRRAGGTAPPGRRPGARVRLPRVLGPQDVRPDQRRRAVGAARASGQDGAVQSRRSHDPFREPRRDDLG